ncbi:MAG: bifunctional pyr operon transcriptional regulator/uracil phosphoribosyltransferase PyrR [Chitinophagaceae bacterium]
MLDPGQLDFTIRRLAHQLVENHFPFDETCFIGLQPRGIHVSDQIIKYLKQLYPELPILYGKLDITFYRDDIRSGLHTPKSTDIPFSIENKKVVLIDDVLYTGRTIRAALDAIIDHGRPSKVELLILIDRKFNRQLPIQPDYVGKAIDSIVTQKVKVIWENEPQVILY